MSLLFDLDDFEETRTEWMPIYKPFGGGLAEYVREERCRDCGRRAGYNQGGSDQVGIFMVCDECAEIDRCRLVCCDPVAERRPARVGHEREECAHCACGWWEFLDHWTDDGEWVAYTPEEVTEMLAHHAEPRHASHWGCVHRPETHDALVNAQAKRRASFLAKAVSA